MNKIYNVVSKIIYYLGLPVVWVVFNNSTRAYLLLEASGQILFVKSRFGNQKYKLPGGGLKKNEPPKNAAARELYEETGIMISSENMIEIMDVDQSYHGANYRHLVYKCKLPRQVWPKVHKLEIMEAVWLSPDKISLHNSNKTTMEAIKKAGFEI